MCHSPNFPMITQSAPTTFIRTENRINSIMLLLLINICMESPQQSPLSIWQLCLSIFVMRAPVRVCPAHSVTRRIRSFLLRIHPNKRKTQKGYYETKRCILQNTRETPQIITSLSDK